MPGAEAHLRLPPVQLPVPPPAGPPGKPGHQVSLPNPQGPQPGLLGMTAVLERTWVKSSGQAQCCLAHLLNMPDLLHP